MNTSTPAELGYYTKCGRPIWREPRGLAAGYSWPQYSIHRGRLQMILLETARRRLGEANIHAGHHLGGFEDDGRQVTATFVNRRSGAVVARDKDRQATLTRLRERAEAVRELIDRHGEAIERRETSGLHVHPEMAKKGEKVTAYSGNGKTVLVILNRSTSAVNSAVIQVPQAIGSAQHTYTSQYQNQAAQTVSVNGQQVTVNVGARSISTVVISQ